MFFILALAATIAYSVQNALMANCYRTMDRLSTVAYRGLAIGICMVPLLFFVPHEDFARLPLFLGSLLVGALLTAIANLFAARAYSFLPVGVATALLVCFGAIFTAIFGYATLGESLNAWQIFCMTLIFFGTLILGKSKSAGSVPVEYHPGKGLISSIFFGLFISGGFLMLGSLSREMHPFLVGYCWELLIGIIAANLALLRGVFFSSGLEMISGTNFRKVLLFSSPTIVGTSCYALASALGPLGILTAILASSMVVNSFLGVFFFQEKLSKVQWAVLTCICLAVAGLKYSA
jgi:drug/metabolite transporter (DMT)-like permease